MSNLKAINGVRVMLSEYLPNGTIVVSKDMYEALKDPEAYKAKSLAHAIELEKAADMLREAFGNKELTNAKLLCAKTHLSRT